MPDWLNRWLVKLGAAPAAPARNLLADYARFDAPFSGYGAQLTPEQAQANFEHFLRVKPERLRQVSGWLQQHAGIDTAPALNAPHEQAHALALTDALHNWALEAWPHLHNASLARQHVWLASQRSGAEVVYVLLLDLAILLGELICRGNPDWRWALDLSTENLNDDMLSARRVVLLANPVGAMESPFVLDVEDIVVGRYLQPNSTTDRLENPWRRMVDEGVSGAAMAYWRTTAPMAN